MPFLASIAASLGTNAIKIALFALCAAALFGGGYVWGSTHATTVAMEASAKAAQEQVAAVSKTYDAMIIDYAAKAKAQKERGDQLADELAVTQKQLAAAGTISKEKLSHVVPKDPICDLPPAALDVLRNQAARR